MSLINETDEIRMNRYKISKEIGLLLGKKIGTQTKNILFHCCHCNNIFSNKFVENLIYYTIFESDIRNTQDLSINLGYFETGSTISDFSMKNNSKLHKETRINIMIRETEYFRNNQNTLEQRNDNVINNFLHRPSSIFSMISSREQQSLTNRHREQNDRDCDCGSNFCICGIGCCLFLITIL